METPDRLLRSFLRIASLKSLSKAADDLNQTQSGVSKQLAALEAHLGKALFTRTGRGVALTEAGQKLQEAIEAPYRAIDHAVDMIRDAHGSTEGTVRLALVHTVSYYFIGDVVASFVSAHPGVNLSMMGRSSPEVVALVESGKADLGVAYDTAVDTASLAVYPLFDDTMCLVEQGSIAPAADDPGVDLRGRDLRLVTFPHGYALRRMLDSAGLKAAYVAEAETVDAMLKLVSAGVGSCILPSRLPDKLLAEYGLCKVKIHAPLLKRRMVAVAHPERQPFPLAAALLSCALQVAKALDT
ncbi:LysR family transcriptional regulator [Cupriavidus alkaliphilus]|uniref:LysR family transcriptional regulator n=1 Tax=Cupriavidus alkaliphilus TaxID=942866 RepID=UPI000DC513D0|nr:LysR family transcriptional regulator [Cupriavidus alkaliphilus]RAS08681.1 DNA-binding transcriptional LysR family regulator [Cupriavidus alkaliphilus]